MKISKILGKFLDQPILVAKFEKKVPYLLTGGAALYTAHCVNKAEPENKNSTLLRVGTTMTFTVLSALLAPKITNKIFKKQTPNLIQIKQQNTEIIDKFIKENKVDDSTNKILNKAKNKALKIKEIKQLYNSPQKDNNFLNKLIPEPENITSKDIFSEIGRLSLLGLIPVLGGIFGGISDGSDIIFRAAVKPTPSIYASQDTVNKSGGNISVNIKGRHDPCIVPRAVPVVEAAAALAVYDAYLTYLSTSGRI